MMKTFEGGCACGAVRYKCKAAPFTMFYCHCVDCQKASGGPFVAGLVVAEKAFQITKGQMKYHQTPSTGGGNHIRGFCAECGSRLTGAQNTKGSPFVGVVVSSLDDPSWFKPEMHFFTSQAQPWDKMDDDLPKYELYPPSGAKSQP